MAIIFYFLFLGLSSALELKQVVIFSRHNLRTPLTTLKTNLSPRVWPKWDYEDGFLTEKGALLEGTLGRYFDEWLVYHKLYDDCPVEPFIYANTKQRTKATAKAFVDSAFRDCNIHVTVKNMTDSDPVFTPIVHNTTEAFRKQAIVEMKQKLKETDLQDAYELLDRILKINESQICKEQSFCSLTNASDDFIFEAGKEPKVIERNSLGLSMVDSFLMRYYEGFPLTDVAWGQIKSEEDWRALTRLIKSNLNTRFDLPKSAHDIIMPILKCIKDIMGSNKTFSLLVGHDSNLTPMITTLGFKKFTLPGQMELVPIGAKLVFQRWTNGTEDFLKIEYVYSSMSQIRNAEAFSLDNPPNNITMYFKDMNDDNGFYQWNEFENIMNYLTELNR